MTKHPATDTHTPPGRDGRSETGDESRPRNSGPKKPLSGPAKWHVWRPAFAYAAQQWFADCPTPPTHEPGAVPDCRCLTFRTWRDAMDWACAHQEAGQ